MGQSKQMLDINGEKLLVKTLQSFLRAGVSKVVVVLGSDEKAHRDLTKGLPVDTIGNPDWEGGMGSSIKAGLRHVTSTYPGIESVILSVCDQPLLSEETISNLITSFGESGMPIIASEYCGAAGVPVLFHKSYFEKLSQLPDGEGAKKIIIQNPSDVSLLSFPGGEIDLDTWEDYEAFLHR